MKRIIANLVLLFVFSGISLAQRDFIQVREFPGVTLADKVNWAQLQCPADASINCILVFDSVLAKYATGTMPDKCSSCTWIRYDTAGYAANSGVTSASLKVTTVGSGLQILSPLTSTLDAYSGGFNAGSTKTQFQTFRFTLTGRTIGEKKGIEGQALCWAKGDCIGAMFEAYSLGGFQSSADEQTEGVRGTATQGYDTAANGGGASTGTVSAVNGNSITVNWATNGALVGEQRPLINTSRGVYSTGTISTVGGSPCAATGSGSSWSTLTTGVHADLFLNITGNDNSTVKHVVPITNIVTDTNAQIEYNLAEYGVGACFSADMVSTGTYNIYKGGVIASLGNVASGVTPTVLNLSAGGTNFQVGDSVQVPLGYNFEGNAFYGVISRLIGQPQGGGVYIVNKNPAPFRDAFRASGTFNTGLNFDNALNDGVKFSAAVSGALLNSIDTTASIQVVAKLLSSGSAARYFGYYDRTADSFFLGGGQYFAGNDERFSTVSGPQANTLGFYAYNHPTWDGLVMHPQAIANAGKTYFRVDDPSGSGYQFAILDLKTNIAKGSVLNFYSDNAATLTASISSANGKGKFASLDISNLLTSNTAPTISSGFGTSPSVTANNGTAAFLVNVGTGGVATSGVIGLPAATTGWFCDANDRSTTSATVFITKQTASTTTTATIGNFNTSGAAAAWAASDIVSVSCLAY